jgi:hypothetical protein
MDSEKYLMFTEETNAVDYLVKGVGFIKTAEENPSDWKWVILAIHAALYSFMICALKGTAGADNVSRQTKKGNFLIDFSDALRRCQDPSQKNISGFTDVLQLSPNQSKAIEILHEQFRNPFTHYLPTLWAIQLAGLPEIVSHVVDVIRFVSLDMGCYYVHYDEGDAAKIAALIDEAKLMLGRYQTLNRHSFVVIPSPP